VFSDIGVDGSGDEPVEGLAAAGPFPDRRRGDVQGADRQEEDLGPWREGPADAFAARERTDRVPELPAEDAPGAVELEARPPHHDELALLEDPFVFAPRPDVQEGVDAQDEKEPGVGREGPDLPQG